MGPPAPPGGSGTIDVTPQNVADAAKDFAKAQNDLSEVWSRVSDALNANGGMAGNDEVARRFNEKYDPGVQAAWKAFEKAIVTHGGISTGLTTTANNFIKADHHSAAGKSRGSPPLFPREPVFSDVYITAPASAVGPGHSALPGPLARFWPNADTGKVRAVASAWHAAASDIDGINARVNGTIAGLKTWQTDDTTAAIDDFWGTVYQPGNPRTVLVGTQQICKALGDACDTYAGSVDAAHSKMKSALVKAGIAIGVTTAIGIGLSFLTFGASDAVAGEADAAEAGAILGPIAAETAETVAAETAAAVGADLVADVEVGAAETATIEAVDAETAEIETALDQEMAAAEDETLGDIGESTRLEGERDYVVDDPADPGRTITDIDHIEKGVLWEEKSATDAQNIDAWVSKHVDGKFARYLEARQHVTGYENAPIGFRFTSPGATPAFRAAVENAVANLRAANPGVRILLEWAP